MKKLLGKNWKTTAVGLITIVISLVVGKGHIDATTGTAITSGIGLILAGDGKSDKKEGE
jgi:hypothetical protein